MNNDTPEKPNTMTETSMKEDMLDAKWEEASRSEVHIFFRKYVSNSRPLQSQASVREKLLVLSHDRFEHLCTDFYDEYLRRKVGMAQGQKLEHLPPVQGLHPTRNLSRMKMAALPPASFRELAEDILYELSRRHPDDATEFSAIGTSMLDISSIEIERRHFLGLDTLATRNPSLTSVDQIQQKPEAVRKNAVPPTLKPKAVKRSLPGGTSLKTASQKKAKSHSPVAKTTLPMIVNGKLIYATPDSGSEQNIIAKDVVTELSLPIKVGPLDRVEFRMGNNRTVKAVGRVLITCQFASELAEENPTNMSCWFYVFQTLITPLIMGMAFLEETETLTRNKHRLELRYFPLRSTLSCASIDNPKRRLQCSTTPSTRSRFSNGGIFTMAVADTGSEVDLVSQDYCQHYKLPTTKIGKRLKVQFADGSTASLFEKVELEVALGQDIRTVPRIRIVPRHTFYVLDGLICDLLFGESFFSRVDNLLQAYSETFVVEKENGFPGVNTIVWFKEHEQIFSWFKRKDKDRKSIASGEKNSTLFEVRMDAEDARENRRREKSNDMIKRLASTGQAEARVIEANKRETYEREKLRLLQARN